MQSGNNFTINIIDICNHAITFNIFSGGIYWTCTGIYASPIPANRPAIWHHLKIINDSLNSPWVLIGDFNEILLPGNQRCHIFIQTRADAFAQVLDHCGLVDLDTIEGSFTWHRNCRVRELFPRRWSEV